MTKLIEFTPKNSFEDKLKEILTSEGYNETIDIENFYRQIYNMDDNTTTKFKLISETINNILVAYKQDPNELISYKNDVDIIFIFKNIAIKVYNYTRMQKYNLDKLYQILSKNECKNLEHILDKFIIDDIFFVVSKVIDTQKYKNEIDEIIIKTDIITGLEYLLKFNWNHRDVSLDNIGFDSETNNYVLFDFGISKMNYSDNINDDLYSLNRSIKFHTEYL